MKKILSNCVHCHCNLEEIYICDACGKNLLITHLGIPIEISFSYGHILDGETYHFCNNQEAIYFLTNEENKQNPRNNIEMGA